MKKVIGILGVAVIVAAMFLNTNAVNGSAKEASLTSLISLNSANAECEKPDAASLDSKCLTLSQVCVGDAGSGISQCKF